MVTLGLNLTIIKALNQEWALKLRTKLNKSAQTIAIAKFGRIGIDSFS